MCGIDLVRGKEKIMVKRFMEQVCARNATLAAGIASAFLLVALVGVSGAEQDFNFKPVAVDYTWITSDTIRVDTSTEIWLRDSTSVAVPYQEQILINGVPAWDASNDIAALTGTGEICYFYTTSCGTRTCPDLQFGIFSIPGVCESRDLPWPWGGTWCVCVYVKLSSYRLYQPSGPGGVDNVGILVDPNSLVTELYEDDNRLTVGEAPMTTGLGLLILILAVAGVAVFVLVRRRSFAV